MRAEISIVPRKVGGKDSGWDLPVGSQVEGVASRIEHADLKHASSGSNITTISALLDRESLTLI
jgi:hypothetical protein